MENTKDIWDIIKIVGALISSILIPTAIFLVGHLYKKQKEKSDEESRQIDKISQFLKHLTSENENERLVALKVSKYLNSQNQLPAELISAVETLSVTDDVSGVLATDVLKQKSESQDMIWEEFETIFNRSKILLNDFFKSNKAYKIVKELAELNLRARNLILVNNELIPFELRQSANSLLRHYNDWLKGYNESLSKLKAEPDDDDSFDYLAAPNILFPRNAEKSFLDYFKQRNANKV